ncbi:hypothetical protein [Pseudomonas viridiflava]|uniref:hypothetical protein n=1 Tax=Pseudomonas viridiflava TaxID=33069 RepID=UPI0013CEF749|nr:hypothetical protein [Pseudomonas viridiflava]
MDPATASRAEIREYVRVNGEALLAFAQQGGNVYQLSLDQQDAMDALIANLSEDEKIRFLNIYTEEMNARTSKVNSETEEFLSAVAKSEVADSQIGAVLAGIAFLILFLIVISKLSS